MRLAIAPCVSCALLLQIATPAVAVTRHVPAEFPNIQAAISASSFGDVVEVAPGIYHERLQLDRPGMTLMAPGGASVTSVNADGLGRVLDITVVPRSTRVVGFRFTSGSATAGGGIRCTLASPEIRDCMVDGNTAAMGGGVYVTQGAPWLVGCTISANRTVSATTGGTGTPGGGGGVLLDNASAALIENCLLAGNVAQNDGGGLLATAQSLVTVRNCTLSGNYALFGVGGGAACTNGADGTFDGVVFTGNVGYLGGSALATNGASPRLTHVTMAFNYLSTNYAGTLAMLERTDRPVVDHTIIARNLRGGGVVSSTGQNSPVFSCSDVFGNANGDFIVVSSPIGTNGNFALDPQFCNPGGGDLSISAVSPCAPALAPLGCGLVGALAPTCAVTTTAQTTWGRLKSRYR